jgi:Mg-chelatase subunit ChlD
MIRWWAFWRRLQYSIGLFAILILIAIPVYFTYFDVEPTCFDSLQNGSEEGIDCGGACERFCLFSVEKPKALWVEAFRIVDGQYNVLAYVENRNKEIGTAELQYTFKVYDADGLIAERTNVTVLPPDGVYPIFEGRIQTGTRVPTRTTIEFAEDAEWRVGNVGREQFMLERRELAAADSKPRLTAQVRNTALEEAQDVEIIATIFDSQKRPLTASRTFVEHFKGRTTEEVVFTWPEPIATTLRSCETPTDVMLAIDLSGSMNNDGDNPPEPITSVLTAAESFITELSARDQVGVATYATEAQLAQQLSSNLQTARTVVTNLTIDPKEEKGSTNIGAGIQTMETELMSARHSVDARKVAILLTDGIATAPKNDPDTYARDAAGDLKKQGIQLFTIGLGTEVQEILLREIASSPSQYYQAPSVRDLKTIYTAITKDICEEGPAVIEVIAKPKTQFEK